MHKHHEHVRTPDTRRGGVALELILVAALFTVMGAVTVWGALRINRAPPETEGAHPASNTGGGSGISVAAAGVIEPGGGVSDEEWAQYVASGAKLYGTTCVACHGPGAVGMPGLGKALAKNAFVQSLDDEALLAFVQKGRDPSDPLNTTGVGMPPKGGNPALSEDDILDIIAYLRTLQGN